MKIKILRVIAKYWLDKYLTAWYGSRCQDRYFDLGDEPDFGWWDSFAPCSCCDMWRHRDIILEYSWSKEDWGKDKEVRL